MSQPQRDACLRRLRRIAASPGRVREVVSEFEVHLAGERADLQAAVAEKGAPALAVAHDREQSRPVLAIAVDGAP